MRLYGLNVMQQRLTAMVNDKAYFLAAVSHDSAPLRRMRLRLERLPDDETAHACAAEHCADGQHDRLVLDTCARGAAELQQVDLDWLVSRRAELATAEEPLPVHGRRACVRCPVAAALPAEPAGQCVALCQGGFGRRGAGDHRVFIHR